MGSVLLLTAGLQWASAEWSALRGAQIRNSRSEPRRLIFGGEVSNAADWPAFVSFRALDGWGLDPPMDANNCGGTLIADQWVITARHCAAAFDPDVPYPQGYNITKTFTVGVAFDNDGNFISIPIEKSWMYPDPRFPPEKGRPVPGVDYPGGFKPYVDAALVKLAMNATEFGAKPVPIYRGPKPFGHTVTAVGMGSCPTDEYCVKGRISLRVREVTTIIASDSNCAPPLLEWGQYNATTSICMGEKAYGKKTGNGDSGGPLFIFNANTSRLESLGIVSGSVNSLWWLTASGPRPWSNNFTRFVWTDFIADWVAQTISQNSVRESLTVLRS